MLPVGRFLPKTKAALKVAFFSEPRAAREICGVSLMRRYFVTFVRDEAGARTSFEYAHELVLVAVLSSLRWRFWGL
jgi:hypothetical protein